MRWSRKSIVEEVETWEHSNIGPSLNGDIIAVKKENLNKCKKLFEIEILNVLKFRIVNKLQVVMYIFVTGLNYKKLLKDVKTEFQTNIWFPFYLNNKLNKSV